MTKNIIDQGKELYRFDQEQNGARKRVPKPQQFKNSGCGGISLLSLLLIVTVGLFSSCKHDPPPRTPITYAPGTPVSTTRTVSTPAPTPSTNTPLVISVWADHSASSVNGGIPHLNRAQLDHIIAELDKRSGALLVGKIGYHSRSDLAILYSKSALAFPQKRQGENSSMYMKRVDAYDSKVAEGKASATGIKDSDLQVFNKRVRPICDYSQGYEGASDISSAVVVSNLFSDEDHLLESSAKYIIIISDGIDYKSHDRFPSSLAKNTELLLVTTLRKVGDLERYRHKKFTSFEGAVRYMLEQ